MKLFTNLALDEDDFSLEAYTIQIRIFYCLPIIIIQTFMVSENLKGKILEKFLCFSLFFGRVEKELNNLDFIGINKIYNIFEL